MSKTLKTGQPAYYYDGNTIRKGLIIERRERLNMANGIVYVDFTVAFADDEDREDPISEIPDTQLFDTPEQVRERCLDDINEWIAYAMDQPLPEIKAKP